MRTDVSLRPGMYGRVEIEAADAGLTLPVEAVLIKDGKDPVVYVETDPLTFVRRSVVVAQPVDGRVQIVSGLSPGDKVVVRGALLLDGAADQLLVGPESNRRAAPTHRTLRPTAPARARRHRRHRRLRHQRLSRASRSKPFPTSPTSR